MPGKSFKSKVKGSINSHKGYKSLSSGSEPTAPSSGSEPTVPRWSKWPIIRYWPFVKFSYGTGWRSNGTFILSTFLSITELMLIALSINSVNELYDDFENNRSDIGDFALKLLTPAICAKLLFNIPNGLLRDFQATKQSVGLAKEIAAAHFSRKSQRREGSDKLAGKLIFDSFDVIRPSLITLHEKVIYQFFGIFIYGGSLVVAQECDIIDISIIGGAALVVALLGSIYSTRKIKEKRIQYLEKYENLYEYISTIVGNYETVQVFDAKSQIIRGITKRLSAFRTVVDKDTYGFGIIVGFYDLILFSSATLGAFFLSQYREYKGDAFIYLLGYSMLQTKNVKELSESSFRIAQAYYSYMEIEEYKKKNTDKKDNKGTGEGKNPSNSEEEFIEFQNVSFNGKITNLSFNVAKGDKIFIQGPSGCGKSCILKLLAGLYRPANKYETFLMHEKMEHEAKQEEKELSIFLYRDSKEEIHAFVQHKRGDSLSIPIKSQRLKLTELVKKADIREKDKMATLLGELQWSEADSKKTCKLEPELVEWIISKCKIPPHDAGIIKINNHELSEISNLSNQLTYIHEKTEIFPFSLADNIKIADCYAGWKEKRADDIKEKVTNAAHSACLDEELCKEKDESKSFTSIDKYSSGQKKRVGLARLFFKISNMHQDNTAGYIVLLDEPVANLDSEMAHTFLKNLKEKLIDHEDKTVFVIEHGKNFKNFFNIGETGFPDTNLYLISQFEKTQCKEIKGNAVILTNANTAYFIIKNEVVMKDEKPQAVEGINRGKIPLAPTDSIKPTIYQTCNRVSMLPDEPRNEPGTIYLDVRKSGKMMAFWFKNGSLISHEVSKINKDEVLKLMNGDNQILSSNESLAEVTLLCGYTPSKKEIEEIIKESTSKGGHIFFNKVIQFQPNGRIVLHSAGFSTPTPRGTWGTGIENKETKSPNNSLSGDVDKGNEETTMPQPGSSDDSFSSSSSTSSSSSSSASSSSSVIPSSSSTSKFRLVGAPVSIPSSSSSSSSTSSNTATTDLTPKSFGKK